MFRQACAAALAILCLGFASPAAPYIDSPRQPVEEYTLSKAQRNAWIAGLKVDRVDLERGVVVCQVTDQLPEKKWPERLRQSILLEGNVPKALRKVAAGQEAVCFAWDRQFTLLVTFIEGAWYLSAVEGGDPSWSRITSLRPDLDALFLGSAADLLDAFRELAAGRDVVVRCRKAKEGAANRFVRYKAGEPRAREPVAALDEVAAKLPAEPGGEARSAVPALLKVVRHEDPLVRRVASRLLERIDPEAAKKASKR